MSAAGGLARATRPALRGAGAADPPAADPAAPGAGSRGAGTGGVVNRSSGPGAGSVPGPDLPAGLAGRPASRPERGIDAPRPLPDGSAERPRSSDGAPDPPPSPGGSPGRRPVPAARAPPRGGSARSVGEKGSSSRPKRTVTNSSPLAGSSSRTTWPTCPAIWPAVSVNTTFGRRPAAKVSRIPSRSAGDNPRAAVRAATIASLRTSV